MGRKGGGRKSQRGQRGFFRRRQESVVRVALVFLLSGPEVVSVFTTFGTDSKNFCCLCAKSGKHSALCREYRKQPFTTLSFTERSLASSDLCRPPCLQPHLSYFFTVIFAKSSSFAAHFPKATFVNQLLLLLGKPRG